MDKEMLSILERHGERLGQHEAAINALQGIHNSCYGQMLERMTTLEERITAAQMDLEGTIEQLRGSLGSVSNLDTKFDRLFGMIEAVQQARYAAWEEHNKHCADCKANVLKMVDERIVIQGNNVDYLGPVGIIKRYWFFSLLAALILGDLFNLVEIIQTGWVHTILYKLLGV